MITLFQNKAKESVLLHHMAECKPKDCLRSCLFNIRIKTPIGTMNVTDKFCQ
ncbi:hypothetical protein I656_03219 [Geobacillus sp. WSUCF1]|nr:hypothetical protein I656_03219 [Geobacillus sp. WSUCF1]